MKSFDLRPCVEAVDTVANVLLTDPDRTLS